MHTPNIAYTAQEDAPLVVRASREVRATYLASYQGHATCVGHLSMHGIAVRFCLSHDVPVIGQSRQDLSTLNWIFRMGRYLSESRERLKACAHAVQVPGQRAAILCTTQSRVTVTFFAFCALPFLLLCCFPAHFLRHHLTMEPTLTSISNALIEDTLNATMLDDWTQNARRVLGLSAQVCHPQRAFVCANLT